MRNSIGSAGLVQPSILHIILGMGVGGVEKGVHTIALGLHARGHRQGVACLEYMGALGSELLQTIPVWSCEADNRRSKLAAMRDLAERIRAFHPDVVHVRNCTAWIYAWFAWKLAGAPGRLVFSIHGLDWNGAIAPIRVFVYRWIARSTSTLLAVSSATADAFAAASGISRDRFRVIHSGVDTQFFRPREVPDWRRTADCVIGCVARLSQRKGHEYLLQAVARLRGKGRSGLRVVIIGDGPYRATLERLSFLLEITDCVTFVGEVHNVRDRLRAMNLFVLPSLSEGRPTSIMEAMATGLPVVATRVGAVDTLVAHGKTGLLVPPGDADALANALDQLLDDEGRQQTFGAEGRRVAESEFGAEHMITEYQRAYECEYAGSSV
ncbi:MAG: glycosyltransferase family 4 protein [Candidatus Accumulibacter phosphatis]|nr:glycosyltransferase family 4 protein [Candidatus Accumulibacter phosphatis]